MVIFLMDTLSSPAADAWKKDFCKSGTVSGSNVPLIVPFQPYSKDSS